MAMNWSEESYVRVYTRDTADLLAVGFEGRATFYELLRHCDRAGVLDTMGDLDVVPELIRVPAEVFRVGLSRLKARGMVRVTEGAIVIPNFQEAQEATRSDRTRQRESRRRRLEHALARGSETGTAPVLLLPDHCVSQNVTDTSQNVTDRHAESHDVTAGHETTAAGDTCHSVLYSALLCCTEKESAPNGAAPVASSEQAARKRPTKADRTAFLLAKHGALCAELWAVQDELRKQSIPGARSLKPDDESLVMIAERLEEGRTVEDCQHVLRVYAHEARKEPDRNARWFNGVTNWRPDNFRLALGKPDPGAKVARDPDAWKYRTETREETEARWQREGEELERQHKQAVRQ